MTQDPWSSDTCLQRQKRDTNLHVASGSKGMDTQPQRFVGTQADGVAPLQARLAP